MIPRAPSTVFLCGTDGHSWLADLAESFKRYGECEQVPTGTAVISSFQEALATSNFYRAVLLGADLAEPDSLSTLREIRAIEAHMNRFGRDSCPVVLFAERQDSHHVFQCFRAQCEGYLVKPYESPRLDRIFADIGITPLGPE